MKLKVKFPDPDNAWRVLLNGESPKVALAEYVSPPVHGPSYDIRGLVSSTTIDRVLDIFLGVAQEDDGDTREYEIFC